MSTTRFNEFECRICELSLKLPTLTTDWQHDWILLAYFTREDYNEFYARWIAAGGHHTPEPVPEHKDYLEDVRHDH